MLTSYPLLHMTSYEYKLVYIYIHIYEYVLASPECLNIDGYITTDGRQTECRF